MNNTHKKSSEFQNSFYVRVIGLEPTRLTTPDPKSGAATNYATRATLLSVSGCKDKEYFLSTKDF